MNSVDSATRIVVPASSSDATQRIVYLDGLRGIAALLIAVFWHYQHFSVVYQPGGALITDAPYYGLAPFRLLYKYSFIALDLFFLLSGFIFSYVYAAKIVQGRIGIKRFAINRFSRLYPLHIATLLYVAIVAWAYHSHYGEFPIYAINDSYHFMLNLLFMQKGFFDRGYSFDGPSWSLSVEALLYVLFFIMALRGFPTSWAFAGIIFSLVLLESNANYTFILNEEIARGMGGFFTGVLLYKSLLAKHRMALFLPLAPLLLSAGMFYAMHHSLKEFITTGLYPLCWCGFSILIMLAHYLSTLRKCLELKPFKILGDLSLGIYLLHVPLQMSVVFWLKANHIAIPYHSPFFLLGYGVLLISLALLVYHYFEMPVQRWLRQRLSRRAMLTASDTPIALQHG